MRCCIRGCASVSPRSSRSCPPQLSLILRPRTPAWDVWQAGLTLPFTLPEELPPLRLLLVWDNLTGHKTPELLLWLCAHGIMPLYTPVGGSWLNMAESHPARAQAPRARRAASEPSRGIGRLFEQTARCSNAQPTPFVWNGKRRQRRRRFSYDAIHRLSGYGACTRQPLPQPRSQTLAECQTRWQRRPSAGLRRREREMAGRASSTHFGKQGRPSNGEW